MKTLAERLADALEKKNGGNQSELARFIPVSPQAVQKWVAGSTEPKGKNLERVAEFLGVPAAYLKYGENYSQPKATVHQLHQVSETSNIYARHPDEPLDDSQVSIKQSKVYFSAGHGHEATYEIIEDSEPATYQLSWFQKLGINPNKVRRFKVTGDSQEPMLYEGDTVLVNMAETNIIDGKLYAIRYGNDLRVKFLSRRLDGTLILKSINPSYKDEEVPPALAEEHISIIGRVRDKSGSGGL